MAIPDVGSVYSHFKNAEHYDTYAVFQHRARRELIKCIDGFLDELNIEEDNPFVICDYGSACGKTSEPFFRHLINKLESKFNWTSEYRLIFEDLPSTDFQAVFKRYGMDRGSQNRQRQLFVSAVGASFFQQVVPSETVDFGMSFFAFHWLSRTPCSLSDGLFSFLSGHKQTEVTA